MFKHIVIFIILFLVCFSPGFGADKMRSAMDVINKEGRLTISDGSSIYTFYKGGYFFSSPKGICGRTIEGKWISPEKESPSETTRLFVVDGKWGWVNGISPGNDFRTMTIWIYPVEGASTERGPQPPFNSKVYKCYFLIDELKKKS